MAGVMTAPAGCSHRMCPQSPTADSLSFRSSMGGPAHFHRRQTLQQWRRPQHSLQVRSALTRPQKEATVAKLVDGLENSVAVFGVRYKGVSVKEFQQFRRELPGESKVIVCKNTLMGIAADKVEGWSELKGGMQDENAWVFANEEVLGQTVKAYMDFEKRLLEKYPKDQRAKVKPTDISIGAMSGQGLDKAQVLKLEKMPTKQELIGTIARLIKQVPTKVAVGVKQVPTKLAIGISKLADGDDNKEAKVGDVFSKAS